MTISSEEFKLSATGSASGKSKSRKRPDPITAAAQSMVAVLEAIPNLGSGWLKQSDLIDRIPGLTAEVAHAALQKAPAKSRIVVAIPNDPSSPLVLKENLESLAQNETFLKALADRGCTADIPVRPLAELTQPVQRPLKKLIDQFWPGNFARLPAGLSPMSVGSGKKKLFAIHDERFPLPEVELSRRLVSELQQRKASGDERYPCLWQSLMDSLASAPDDELVRRAVQQAPFAGHAREISTPGGIWVALKEDVSEILRRESFLRRLVENTCQAATPEVKLSVLARQLPKDLQPEFLLHWHSVAESNRALDFVAFQPAGTAKKRDFLLRDRRFPPVEQVLAEKMVKILANQKELGESSYPVTWGRLLELSGTTDRVVLAKAIRTEPFQSQVTCSVSGDQNAPVALAGDEGLLAACPKLLSAVMSAQRTEQNQLIAVDKLAKHKGLHPNVAPFFPAAIETKIREATLPEGIGGLKVGKKWGLFLLSDVAGTKELLLPRRDAPQNEFTVFETSHFERDFDLAFAQLDGKLGLPNYASLVDLRPALKQYPREVFDQELLKLRRVGRYSLSLVEGRFGLSDDERAACLVVDHVSHLLVQKKSSRSS